MLNSKRMGLLLDSNSNFICSRPFLTGIAAIVFLSALLVLLRLLTNISFSEPLHLITSGSEEQSFLSLWKFIYGQPVYSDPYKIPFTFSYLNWLFYVFYGIVIKEVLAWTQISDAWIPTIGRLISCSFSIAGFLIARQTLTELFGRPSRKMKFLFLLVSFYLFFGPLDAFWPLTVRPDMAAAALELLAFYFFLKEFRNPLRAAFMASVLAFAAWSFKQSNITVILSLIIFSFFHERRAAWLMIFMMAALCSLTLYLGGPEYRQSTLFHFSGPSFSWALGLKNFFYYIVESAFVLPGYLTMGMVLFSKGLRDEIQSNKTYQLCFVTAIVTSLFGWLTSHKVGASENYFIPAGIFVTFFALIPLLRGAHTKLRGLLLPLFYFSLVLNAALVLVILFGIKGHVSKRYEHREVLKLLKCVHSLDRPIFSQTTYLNLPWMNGGESFIPGYTYWVEKQREKVYERGGIEGLIKEGYFASLILEKGRMGEIVGTGVQAKESLGHYTELKMSGCPSTHAIFIKTGS